MTFKISRAAAVESAMNSMITEGFVFTEEEKKKEKRETHEAGRTSCHGDNKGIYELYPDGTNKYIKKKKKGDFE